MRPRTISKKVVLHNLTQKTGKFEYLLGYFWYKIYICKIKPVDPPLSSPIFTNISSSVPEIITIKEEFAHQKSLQDYFDIY